MVYLLITIRFLPMHSRPAGRTRQPAHFPGLSSDSSEEDLVNAVESFESYMLEQVIKQMKDSVTSDDDQDSTMSQYTDMYMDATIQQLAGEMVSEYGGSLTDQLVRSDEAQLRNRVG